MEWWIKNCEWNHLWTASTLNDFELYNVHDKSAKIEKWSIFSTKVDYVEFHGKALLTE